MKDFILFFLFLIYSIVVVGQIPIGIGTTPVVYQLGQAGCYHINGNPNDIAAINDSLDVRFNSMCAINFTSGEMWVYDTSSCNLGACWQLPQNPGGDSCRDTIQNNNYTLLEHVSYTNDSILKGDLVDNLADGIVVGFFGDNAVIANCGTHYIDTVSLVLGEYFASLTPGLATSNPPTDSTNVPLFELISPNKVIVNLLRPLSPSVQSANENVITGNTSGFEKGTPIVFFGGEWVHATSANVEGVHTAFVCDVFNANSFSICSTNILRKDDYGLIPGSNYYVTENGIGTAPSYSISDWCYTVLDENYILLVYGHAHAKKQYVNNFNTRNNISLPVRDAIDISLKINTYSGNSYVINWGDGALTAGIDDVIHAHSYTSSFSGEIKVTLDGTDIQGFDGNGSLSFDVAPFFNYTPLLERFTLDNDNKCYGDFSKVPPTIKYIDAPCDCSGNVTQQLRDGLIRFRMTRGHVIVDNLPSADYVGVTANVLFRGLVQDYIFLDMTHLDIQGRSNLGGDIGLSLYPLPPTVNISGLNTISTYTPNNITFNANPERFIIAGTATLSTTDIDNLLIDIDAAAATWNAPRNLFISAGNFRSSVSDAAFNSLLSKNVNVVISL